MISAKEELEHAVSTLNESEAEEALAVLHLLWNEETRQELLDTDEPAEKPIHVPIADLVAASRKPKRYVAFDSQGRPINVSIPED
jgi:hypothetical protein